jgi:hypothetical protein
MMPPEVIDALLQSLAKISGDSSALATANAADQNSPAPIASKLTGAINAEHSARLANLILDASSHWNVSADSTLTCLNDANGISGSTITNITGNGYTVYYDSSVCTALGGQTYTLNGGGFLKPTN